MSIMTAVRHALDRLNGGEPFRWEAGERLRNAENRIHGLTYVMCGRHPDSGVTDDVLADRIRSQIGPLEKRLDVPRVHVSVCNHIATLHGAVPTGADAVVIEEAVADVAGVKRVNSRLHIGLSAASTRPSASRRAHAA